MLDYIWIDDKSPILKQLPSNFKSAAILLHPFVQMPSGWEETMRKNPCQHIYPSNEEIYNIGKPVSWREIMSYSGLESYKELAVALLTSIGAFKKGFEREDLADKLNLNLKSDLYYPTEDSTSVFLLDSLLKVICSKGACKLYFSNPIFDNSGLLNLNDTTPLDICNLSDNELIVTDENMDYAFMSLYDSFATLLFTKDKNIEHIVQSMKCEGVICEQRTFINWYF
ncbi:MULTISPECIES: DUF2711 family protein [unclassified Bacillus (in: firmicutes)]|uniref:DUF2711 family protein n=1 Tax=unclassified Bacillus (in: firmicutes) TaxID=185979 RepID=UPI0008E592DE|nr:MULTISPECIES: DUF2711 family protein [unclassified Bacillus (in: firmicutes)]SFA99555.1 Protein of unknown function [Bacillus sp. UNCCL13]SFQ81703.1 Protein of unknown function [Bacillus sp. cl95]